MDDYPEVCPECGSLNFTVEGDNVLEPFLRCNDCAADVDLAPPAEVG